MSIRASIAPICLEFIEDQYFDQTQATDDQLTEWMTNQLNRVKEQLAPRIEDILRDMDMGESDVYKRTGDWWMHLKKKLQTHSLTFENAEITKNILKVALEHVQPQSLREALKNISRSRNTAMLTNHREFFRVLQTEAVNQQSYYEATNAAKTQGKRKVDTPPSRKRRASPTRGSGASGKFQKTDPHTKRRKSFTPKREWTKGACFKCHLDNHKLEDCKFASDEEKKRPVSEWIKLKNNKSSSSYHAGSDTSGLGLNPTLGEPMIDAMGNPSPSSE